MARGPLTPQELANRQIISDRLKRLLSSSGATQAALSKAVSIPKSTLTGYFKGTTTPNAKNIQKFADYFGVKKSDIDPRFAKLPAAGNQPLTNNQLRVAAAVDSDISDQDCDRLIALIKAAIHKQL